MMQIRTGFVSNSSSTAFIVTNITNEHKTLLDFAAETLFLVEDFRREYSWDTITEEEFIRSASSRHRSGEYTWKPKEEKYVAFGDEDGDTIGRVYDYMLRGGGETKSFRWRFREYLR